MGFWRASSRRRIFGIAAAAFVATALIGCGRKGDPLPPPDASASATPKANPDQTSPTAFSLAPPPNPPIAKPTGSFVLDPLLK